MRLKIFAILAILALVGAGGSRALASVDGPAQGEPASVVSLEGEEIATISVTDLQDPFEEYSDFTEPEEGARFVMVAIEVENTGDRPFEVSPYRFFVRDTLGRTYGSGFLSVDDDFEEENLPLEDRNMSSGETHSGVLYFVVAEDAVLSDVLYQSSDNDTSVLISIADLNESEAGGGGGGSDDEATPDDDAAADEDDSSSADDEDSDDNTGSDVDSDDSDDDDAESTPES